MKLFNLAIAWNWEFDADFIAGIEHECALRGISTYRINADHLRQTLKKLKEREIAFQAFFDRASDADAEFLLLVQWMEEWATCLINPRHRVVHAVDKATMHLEFLSHGLHVPTTIILSPYNEQPHINLSEDHLKPLGTPLVIKPANTTGGGTGVILNVNTLEEILMARQEHKNDKYLVQETTLPKDLDGKRAWFRVYFAFGETIPCWWDDKTHRYTELTPDEEKQHDLHELRRIMRTIQAVCTLDFFSSEIALTERGEFVVVDYVNEVCDMRLQSKYYDGAPDAIVHRIERLMAEHVQARISRKTGGNS
jgi:hypothetical protein